MGENKQKTVTIAREEYGGSDSSLSGTERLKRVICRSTETVATRLGKFKDRVCHKQRKRFGNGTQE